MRLFPAIIITALLATPSRAQTIIPGFAASRQAAQHSLEQQFLAVPSAAAASAAVRELASRPHLSGTTGAAITAEWLATTLRDLGFDVTVDEYQPWLPHPGRASVTMLQPVRRELSVREPVPANAPPTLRADAMELASWHAYSGNGIAEGEVIYANYGTPDDYAALERAGVDVRGRIVLVRLGRVYRGSKLQQAEQRGAIGMLLYPDPSGDGWAAGDTLPRGPFRPAQSVQRGTLAYMWRYTGDPLTPGVAARLGATRITPEQAINLPRIPAVPIGYADAEALLHALQGREPPAGFRGALRVPYRVGPGPLRVRMAVQQEYAQRTIRNVIARLPGRTSAHVIIGNHFDAWTLGGVDPHTGTAVTLEIARGLAALKQHGWMPRRGITIAFWDAEEFGVVGSSEWVEEHAAALQRDAVAYFNIDVFTAGVLDVSGSPALRDLVVSAAEAVRDPLTQRPLADTWRDRQVQAARRASVQADTTAYPRVTDIGAGSDWTAFLHHIGVPSLQWTMNGRGSYAVYHSVHDDYDYYRRFADSAFVHTPAMAGVMGVAALRLADADALPFRYAQYGDRIRAYIGDIERSHQVVMQRQLALADSVRAQGRLLEELQQAALARSDTAALTVINTMLPRIEQAFLDPAGLPGRPWYRHPINAPGSVTGYDPLPLPAVAEALETKQEAALDRALAQLDAALIRARDALAQTIAAARAAARP